MPGLGASSAVVAAPGSTLPPGVRMEPAKTTTRTTTTTINNTTATTTPNEKPKLDPSDPRVRKLVYSMYRDMLTTYNGEANDIISKKDPAKVTQDSGVGPILESIIIRQRSTQGGGGDASVPAASESQSSEAGNLNGAGNTAMPPPPPPPMMPGALPTVRLNSEIGPRDKGPPAALAGAMMKDKKPFTYTPGGIDLSEIRSPRMAKRIAMNALAEGVTNTPKPSSNNQQERPPCHLPPAALAAMQPQMAIPVFPQGGISAMQLHKQHKPADFGGPPPPPPPMPASPVIQASVVSPPLPPPAAPQLPILASNGSVAPPPPPSPQTMSVAAAPLPSPVTKPVSPPILSALSPPTSPVVAPPSPQQQQLQLGRPATPLSPMSPKSPPPPPSNLARTPPPPPDRASTPKSPVPSLDSYVGGNSRPESQASNHDELRKSPLGRKSPEVATGVGTGCIYIPPIQSPPPPPPPPASSVSPMSSYVPPSSRPAGQTKAQAVSQNIGSIYIPPIGPLLDQKTDNVLQQQQSSANGGVNISRAPQSFAQGAATPQTPFTASIPSTPQLNRAPVPWMNSYNRMQSQQADSPPYVHPGYFMPPWAAPPGARTIPIMMQRESDQADGGRQVGGGGGDGSRPSSSASSTGTPTTPTGSRTPSQAATHLGRVIPIQIEREDVMRQKGAKIIPIQIEGRPPRAQTPSTPTTPGMNPMRRAVAPAPYNSPMGLYSNQNAMDAYQRQAAEAAAAGVDRMTVRCESPRTEPAQSKAMRVIQQAAENELKRLEQEQQRSEGDGSLMSLFKSQVDDGPYLHQAAEPRFMGSHIPSKAFRALQTALPASPGAQDQPPPSFPAAQQQQPGQCHYIPIRTVSQSPTPQSQGSVEIQLSSNQSNNVPPSEQKVQEPKKYMGSNIPSRSFKILQAMTADDGQSESASSSEQNLLADCYDDTTLLSSPCPTENNAPLSPCSSSSSFPYSLSFSSSEGGGSSNFDPYGAAAQQNPWPDIMDQGWDPYSYMWYYWWYYASCYWAGYDMTGYEYPPGWDPNYPYCPPELFGSDYPSSLGEYMMTGDGGDEQGYNNNNNLGDSSSTAEEQYSSTAAADLDKSSRFGENGQAAGEEVYCSREDKDNNDDDGRSSRVMPFEGHVPKIVIDGEFVGTDEERQNSVDSIKGNNNSNHNDGGSMSSSSRAAPSPLTECNQKPGNPIPRQKRNDCDSVMGDEKMGCNKWNGGVVEDSSARNGNDNDDDDDEDEDGEDEEGENASSSSSSEDEYESCCSDEQKVIERETGPCHNKPFVSQNPNNFSESEQQHQQQSRQRKFEFHGNYNCELNANDDDHDHQAGREQKAEEDGGEDEEEDEKTDPGTDDDNDDDDDYGGRAAIIEEPETPSSADDSDGAPLGGNNGKYTNGGLSIEEYHSEESSESAVFDYGLKKNRLSTIDEITESRASSSLFSRNLSAELDYSCIHSTNNSTNLLNPTSTTTTTNPRHNNDAIGELEESEESSEDELSSVSVIENKSDATRGTESKREDETSSSSEEDSSTDDDDEDEDAGGADTAVTVRLPLKLCFTKTKSYRDITTVMVGDSEIETNPSGEETARHHTNNKNEVEEDRQKSADHHNDDDGEDGGNKVAGDTDEEPVVSFTLSLSRQSSREDETKTVKRIDEGYNEKIQVEQKKDHRHHHDEQGESYASASADIDFWAAIKGAEEPSSPGVGVAAPQLEETSSNQGSKEDYRKEDDEADGVDESGGSGAADVDFWGTIARDRSATHISRALGKRRDGMLQDGRDEDEERDQDESSWDPYESIDYKWEKDFNFWEKSSRTIETRRFSNFEITEDYESDSGIKPSSSGKKERTKKYTHHKRHSIPGPGWADRASLPPRPTTTHHHHHQKQNSSTSSKSSLTNEQEISSEGKQSTTTEQQTTHRKTSGGGGGGGGENGTLDPCQTDDTDASSWWSYWDDVSKKTDEEKCEPASYIRVEKTVEESASLRIGDDNEDRVETISDSMEMNKQSETERANNTGESCSEDDYQSFGGGWLPGSSRLEASGLPSSPSSERKAERKKTLNHSCPSDATTVTTDNEDYSISSPEIKSSSLLFPSNQEAEKLIQGSSTISVSDENSDESSSRSSGTTIGRHDTNNKSENKSKQQLGGNTAGKGDGGGGGESHLSSLAESPPPPQPVEVEVEQSIQIPVSVERTVEIQTEDAGERIKSSNKCHHVGHGEEVAHNNSSISTTSSCTCLIGDRIARAENLLWRIERFLHESLSLGSEDDSGVMTDLSRQISDVDTDVDNDLNETEFLLTAAAAAKERRGMGGGSSPREHIESCNFAETISSTDTLHGHGRTAEHQQQQQVSPGGSGGGGPISPGAATSTQTQVAAVKKPRPKSDIILESSLSKLETTTTEVAEEQVNTSGVKMRSASERRALRYQRAKTHSRLFQLLQDECGRDEEVEEFDYDSDMGTPTYGQQNSVGPAADCQITSVDSNNSIRVDTTTTTTGGSRSHSTSHSPCSSNNGITDDPDGMMARTSPGMMMMSDAQARRSRLLPLPIKNLLASSLSLDSNSSPSGSSGVLSPTSPVNRDQLLADIINEFHLRNQQSSSLRAQNQKRISSSFPSKIFKLLQHEFGEEFYQTFDCCGGACDDGLISPCVSSSTTHTTTSSHHLCVNESLGISSSSSSPSSAAAAGLHSECTIHKSESMKEFEEATNRILTNFMLRNKPVIISSNNNSKATAAAGVCQPSSSESPSSTANMSPSAQILLQDDSKKTSADFLEVPMRRKKGGLARDTRSPKSTKKS